LAHEAATAGADGHAHGHFAFTCTGASEKKIREIGGGDQQHESSEREKDAERVLVHFAQIGNAGIGRQGSKFVGEEYFGVLWIEDGRQSGRENFWRSRAELRGGAVARPAGLEAADNGKPPCGTIAKASVGELIGCAGSERVGAKRECNIEVAAYFDTIETRPRDADDGEWMSVDGERTVENRRITGELMLPKRIAEDDASGVAGEIVIGSGEQAAERR
jgi:hypothetical protein